MASFYTKAPASPFLSTLLKTVEGQVRSAMNDHKEWNLPERAARSIAKRIAGDVAANWQRLEARRNLGVGAQ